MIRCEICDSTLEDCQRFYKNTETDETICITCVLEQDMVTTYTVTQYYLDGRYIGDDEDLEPVCDEICKSYNFEEIKEDEYEN